MDSNTHSTRPPGPPAGPSDGSPDRLGAVVAAKQQLAAEDLDQLPEAALAEDTDRLRALLDGLEGEWLRHLAAVAARGAAGADQDQAALSTASWLRNRLHMGGGPQRGPHRPGRVRWFPPRDGRGPGWRRDLTRPRPGGR